MLQQYLTSYLRLLKSVSKCGGPIRVKPCYIIIGVWIYLVFSSFWQRKAFFSFSLKADWLLVGICTDLHPKDFPKHPWVRDWAHGSRRSDINLMFTHQLTSSTATSNGTQKIRINLGNHRRCISLWLMCFQVARHGAMGSFRDYVISFYSDRTPELKTGLEFA